MLFLKNLIFTIVVPGTVTVLAPYLILDRRSGPLIDRWSAPEYLALVPIALGAAICLRCVWDFAANPTVPSSSNGYRKKPGIGYAG